MVAPTCPYRKRKTADFTRLRVDSMDELCGLIWCAIAGLFRSRAALQAEILVLRHQLNVLRRRSPRRVAVSNVGRLVFVGLYRLPRTCEVGKTKRRYTCPDQPRSLEDAGLHKLGADLLDLVP